MKNKSKGRVAIIGGGVSGLTTGVYLQMNGYDTEIYEMNTVVGGACVGWERKGCYIDGCIHWLTGVNEKSAYYDLWVDTDALTDETEMFYQTDIHTFEFEDGKRLTIWADLEKTRAELVAFAPEDEKQINEFIKMVKRFQRIEGPVDKPVDHMGLLQLIKIGLTMAGDYYWVNKTSKVSCGEFASRFKNRHLKKAFENIMSPGYNLMSMLYMLGHISGKNGGIPIGGSLPLVKRMEERYLSLGGKVRLDVEVNKVIVQNNRAVGLELKGGEVVSADWVVSSTPVEHCLKKLLGGRYAVKKIDERLADINTYPIYTYTTVALKCNADITDKPLSLKVFLDEPITFDRAYEDATIRNYSYDKTLKVPDGASVLQVSLHGGDDMYFWWKDKKIDGSYRGVKASIGNRLLAVVENAYPDLKGKLEVIDVITPCTYERYLNTRHGSFQGFVHTSTGKALMQKGLIKGLKGFILSGQGIFRSGGLPAAAIVGRFSAQRICKADGVKFKKA